MTTPKEAAERLAASYGVVVPSKGSFTDLGNAERLVAYANGSIHYSHQRDKWLIWDGRRWSMNDDGEIFRLATNTIRQMYKDAAQLASAAGESDDSDTRTGLASASESLVEWGRKTESRSRIDAMIYLTRSRLGVPILFADLDQDPWLFNCANGTLDLRDGTLREHRQSDLITRLSPASYDPDATYGLLDDFLERILPDLAVRGFVQRSLGYSLTGNINEEKLFFAYGPTGTGKSTLLRAVAATLGDYAATADFGTFLQQDRGGKATNDIARLAGKRFVTSIEVDDGQKMAEALVLQITGGDLVPARFLYGETFEFIPTFKLWLAANSRPRVRDDNDANWRRITQIPFSVQIPENERDSTIKESLSDPDTAGPALLAWLVRGCLDWHMVGLLIPDAVRETTTEYRDEMNPLTDFLEDCCVFHPQARCDNGAVFQIYLTWAKTNNVTRPIGRKTFTQRLERLPDIVNHRNGQGRFWEGIGLLRDTSSVT